MNNSLFSGLGGARRWLAPLLATGALAIAAMPAQAQIPGFSIYAGAGIGQSQADIDDVQFPDFDDDDTAWKAFAGVRLLGFLGAGLDYIDFGKAGSDSASVNYEALAGYAMFFLPIAMVDLYAKAGLAKVDANIDPLNVSTDDTEFAYGLGVQLKFCQFHVRGEWEEFEVADGDLGFKAKPTLFSLGFSYSFL